ncbi:MAG: LITAF-like zinc ribbon domain-containing protein [Pyrinomonadaceae bacterium]
MKFLRPDLRRSQFEPQKQPAPADYQEQPPRPYSWKTDEFTIPTRDARETTQISIEQMLPVPSTGSRTVPLAAGHQNTTPLNQYACPRCGSTSYPIIDRKISTAGWIVFSVLLLTFLPLFWIGFLIKEDVYRCPVCQLEIS